jgi:hypothetical protein
VFVGSAVFQSTMYSVHSSVCMGGFLTAYSFKLIAKELNKKRRVRCVEKTNFHGCSADFFL